MLGHWLATVEAAVFRPSSGSWVTNSESMCFQHTYGTKSPKMNVPILRIMTLIPLGKLFPATREYCWHMISNILHARWIHYTDIYKEYTAAIRFCKTFQSYLVIKWRDGLRTRWRDYRDSTTQEFLIRGGCRSTAHHDNLLLNIFLLHSLFCVKVSSPKKQLWSFMKKVNTSYIYQDIITVYCHKSS